MKDGYGYQLLINTIQLTIIESAEAVNGLEEYARANLDEACSALTATTETLNRNL